jgi:acyl transferase domain-containing protein/acyl-CoA synthetase (AMP-forming)/AMP-acid ligase II/acyl carrier protein
MHFDGLLGRIADSIRSDADRRAFTFLEYPSRGGDARVERALSIGQLHQRALAVAARLRKTVRPGDPVLLLFRPGLDFVVAFVGCLYAGAIAVPVPSPRRGLGAQRVQSILGDCGARVALATSATREVTEAHLALPDGFEWALVDELDEPPAGMDLEPADPSAVAMLQYSSGSTGEPKGVMITHVNLIHQAGLIYDQVGANAGDCWATWLPIYHDMGLISAIVTPLAKQLHSVMMAPESFALRPARWLRALSDYRASCCASPNFGYELCARKVRDDELDGVDLSCVRFAVSGAEPIRAATVERFLKRFGPLGFGDNVIYPAYGLAEATLLATGRSDRIEVRRFDTASLAGPVVVPAQGDRLPSTSMVSCGLPRGGNRVVVTDPESGVALPELHVGEIRVAGQSVGLGYWRAGGDGHGFASPVAGHGDDPYLHTGDLGFFHEGELFVCGRLKDLLVIRGSNHHAADIEQTVEAVDQRLVSSGGAAFAIDADDEERLVVLYEVEREGGAPDDSALADIAMRVRRSISERHQISPYEVVLVAGGLTRTSSGKIRRHVCREHYLHGRLKPLFVSRVGVSDGAPADAHPDAKTAMQRKLADCEVWLARQIAELVKGADAAPGPETSLAALQQDAAAMIEITDRIKRSFGLSVPYTAFADHDTVGALAAYLATGVEAERSSHPQLGGRLSAEQLAASGPDEQVAGQDEPVAIIGIACRFPSADGPREFWDNLCKGVDAVTEVPADRWDADAMYDPNPLAIGKMNTRRGGFIRGVELFDARFFGIQNREATRMDPAHRMLLELSWEAFEDAGVLPQSVSGRQVGVFIGISGSDYAQLQFGDDALSDPYAGVGCALTNSASRISHFHNLRGPALAIDTACSSSLSAMHIGATAIRTGECEMALVGGVNVILAPNVTMSLSKAGMMASDGRCKTFDKKADGYVRSEGAGLLLLKPLSRAKADGDAIYAVIRGSATNQDGHGSAISAPNGEAQQRVIKSACERAGVLPGDLDYVEAHGTGTALGDPIEVNALGELLKLGSTGKPCPIGSVKTNIGHCESAAGTASLIKAAMVLQHGTVPPSLHFEEPNPLIPFDDYTVRVQSELGPLAQCDRPRLAGVNSFGIGGTNVHVVLEEHVGQPVRAARAGAGGAAALQVLAVSGKTERALKANAEALAGYLRREDGAAALEDIGYTLALRRTHFDHRLCVVGSDRLAMAEAIEAHLRTQHQRDVLVGHYNSALGASPEVAFVYAGQGSQWWAMGRRLFESEPVYRVQLERCDAELSKYTGWSLIEVLAADERDSRLEDTVYLQPTLFAVQYAITALLASWGVRPAAVVGHSFGEITAACVSGAIGFEDACRLIAARARLMSESKGRGRMVSVEMPRDALEAIVGGYGADLSIAASNSPGTTVVSGTDRALRELIEQLDAQGVANTDLGLDYAFHSILVEDAGRALAAEAQSIEPRVPQIALMSTVRADWTDAQQLPTAEYWGRNIREEVRFKDAIEAMARHGSRVFVEIGGHPVLSGATSRTLASKGVRGTVLPTLMRDVDDEACMKRCFAGLHAHGVSVDWRVPCGEGAFVRELPRYAWDRSRYWMDAPHHEARKRFSTHPLMSIRMPVSQPTWQSRLDINAQPYVRSVRIRDGGRLTNGLYVELALEAAAAASGLRRRRELVDLAFHDSLGPVEDDAMPMVQSRVGRKPDGCHEIRVDAQVDDSQGRAEHWMPMFECSALTGATAAVFPEAPRMEAIRARTTTKFSGTEIYRKLGEIGVEYVHAAHVADEVHVGNDSTLLRLRLNELVRGEAARFHLHPLVFEAMEQACRLAAGSGMAHTVLTQVRRLRVVGTLSDAVYAYATVLDRAGSEGDGRVRADVWVLDAHGTAVALAEGVELEAPATADSESASGIPDDPAEWRYTVEWAEAPVPDKPAETPEKGHWLVLADAAGVAQSVAARLRSRGQECLLVRPGEGYLRTDASSCTVRTTDASDMERLVRELYAGTDRSCRGVLHLWNLDAPVVDGDVPADYANGLTSLVDVVRALSMADLARAPRLWLVTAGAQPVEADERGLSLVQSMAWGCAKTIVHEHAELRCARVDLAHAPQPEELDALCEELFAERLDDQLAFRGNRRYVARLGHQPQAQSAAALVSETAAMAWSLAADGEGRVALKPAARRRRSPGPDQIEVGVEAAEVERDGTGTLRTGAMAGRVLRVGTAVRDLRPGQRVVSIDGGTLASHQSLRADAVAVLADTLDAARVVAATSSYLTALFGMREVACVGRGERVLVRIDDMRRGLAAVRVACWLGAKVLVAAPRILHAALEGMEVLHVFDEGDPLGYARAVVVEGGLDAVINAAGEFGVSSCPRLLRPFGCCVDLYPEQGPRAALSIQQHLPSNCRYAAVDFQSLCEVDPGRGRALLAEVVGLFAIGAFALDEAETAALDQLPEELAAGDDPVTVVLDARENLPPRAYRDDACYLLTGGLGGLGLAMARRMVRDGARHLVLVGRRPPSLSALDVIEELNAGGARCTTMSVDMGDMQAVQAMFATIRRDMPPLRGVIHAAGVLNNGLLVQMGHEQVRSVMPAKVHGAWNLHRVLAGEELDFFVLFSSLASFIGSPGQSNYAAANAFLEALAEHRRVLGLPALSIAWGPWSEAGMAADVHNLQRLAQHGMGMVQPDKGLDLLEDLVLERQQGAVGALPMNWNAWARTRGYAAQTPYFASLVSSQQGAGGSNGRITRASLAGKAPAEQMEMLTASLLRIVCHVLMLGNDQVELDAPLTSIGLDSIVSLELKDRIESSIDVVVRTNALVAGKSIRNLAEQFLEDLAGAGGEPAPASAAPTAAPSMPDGEEALLERIDELSDAQIEAMLGDLGLPDAATVPEVEEMQEASAGPS